jgi:hypothetical protein
VLRVALGYSGRPVDALEAILARVTVPILRQGRPPELVAALLPSLIRTMLTAFDGGATGVEGVDYSPAPLGLTIVQWVLLRADHVIEWFGVW